MEHIIVTRPRPGVMLITLNRPHSLNALNKALLIEVAVALNEAVADADVGAVVLTGDERSFSAGADIKEMPEAGIPPFAQADRLKSWKTIERHPKPLIAAVNGYALGGGCELTQLCDIVIAGANAQFGTPEIKIAAFAGDGGTQRIPRAVGKARAMMMTLTGEPIDAATALAWGLVVEVVPVERTVDRALEIAESIAEKSPLAVQMAKAEILMSFEKPLDESLSLERKMLMWQSEDHQEGINAFVEKRAPRFTGR
ncbi:MAG TPA: enoyl-CoA hydratase-related protein [Rhodospirillales bacterium]|jgi:enoyl-CoA hydratase|nr:enoyl-CoA hydratase-related protein [Rhodospirillales bacterium]HJO68305.1 enoyl-CoA hydratase-related protein [Rhodospirillales bacterium]